MSKPDEAYEARVDFVEAFPQKPQFSIVQAKILS